MRKPRVRHIDAFRGPAAGAGDELGNPGGADRHDDAQRQAAQHAAGGDDEGFFGSDGQQEGPGQGERCRGQHRGAPADIVRQWPGDKQRGHDANDVGRQEAVDGDLREVGLLAVHHEQGSKFIAAPGNGHHAACDG